MRRKTIIALVFVVAAAVLVESWHAAMNAAATGGRPWPLLWPVTLEAFILVLVLVYWDARSTDRKAPMARVLLAVVTGVASAVQILDAPATWLGWLTAGWTPVALLLSVEFAVWLLYGAETRPAWEPTPLGHPVPDPDQPEPEPEPVQSRPRVAQDAVRRTHPATRGGPAATRSSLTQNQVDQVRQWVAEGRHREISKRRMAEELGLTNPGRLALGRLVNDLVSQNGDGPGGGS